jgi:UDP-N-acetylmuramoyl-L-alanyl-D-glutamate--2,6-diaminopimelate ligase
MSMPAEILGTHGNLKDLLRGFAHAPDLPLSGIAADSRRVEAGDVFLACQGTTSHGLEYLDQALEAGAVAVVWDSATGSPIEAGVPMIPVDGLADHLGEIANRWFHAPSKTVRVTGVTGTNGKTTVAYLIQQCMELLQWKCAYIGTLGSGFSDIGGDGSMTTPPCIELHKLLAEYREQGAQHAAIEVSSHALEQKRVDGVHFESAIFTNLSRDHIDYHGSMRAYFESKASLFLDNDIRNRIVCLDTDFGSELAGRCGANVVTVSARADSVANGRPYVFARAVKTNKSGSNISIESSWGSAELSLSLPGKFNVANAAQVLALLLCQDVPLAEACGSLSKVSAPRGRMQLVTTSTDTGLPAVYVDYSHTPASLEAALKALRGHCRGKLWCVFGCGGDRDRGKRPMMGEVAERLADFPIVTSDNPRTEAPGKIIADIMDGMSREPTTIKDRNDAIAHAVSSAGDDDVVLVAGKGHEAYQIIGTERIHFSDIEVAAKHLAARRAQGAQRK